MFTQIPAKHEMVLMHVLNGLPGSHAYAMVYGQDRTKATCEVNASRILSSAKVQARKHELLAARAARQPISLEFLTAELVAIAGESRALGQGSAAVAAVMGVAKLHGMIVDKVQSDVLVRKPSGSPESPDDMSPDDWLGRHVLTIDHEAGHEGTNEHSTSDGSTSKGPDLMTEARALGLVEP